MGHADAVVLVLMPGSGDSVQALKAGIMEVPDIIVVNKADHPMADTMVRQVRSVLSTAPGHRRVPIVKTEALSGIGIDTLIDALARHRDELAAAGELAERRRRNLANEVLVLAASRLRARLAALVEEDPEARALLDAVVGRTLDPASAARQILGGELTGKLDFSDFGGVPHGNDRKR
jgi:LAO/AO transport system kinase